MRKSDFTKEQIKEVIRLYNEEMLGTPSIGKIFGIGKRSINQLLKEYNVVVGVSGRKFKGGKKVSNKKYREKKGVKEKQKKYMDTYGPKYYEANKETKSKYYKEYRKNNIDKERKRHAKYHQENIIKIKKYRKDELTKKRRNGLHKIRYNNEPLYKLKCNISGLIKQSFKSNGVKKNTKTQQILGCSIIFFKQHLEKEFEPWMNWKNYGNPKDGVYELNKTWDIDHIIPISTAITENDIIRLNYYTNLQPLCSYTNRFIKRNLPI